MIWEWEIVIVSGLELLWKLRLRMMQQNLNVSGFSGAQGP